MNTTDILALRQGVFFCEKRLGGFTEADARCYAEALCHKSGCDRIAVKQNGHDRFVPRD